MSRKVISGNLIAVLVCFFVKGVEGQRNACVYTSIYSCVHTHIHTVQFTKYGVYLEMPTFGSCW